MIISASDYVPAPEGMYQAACVDVEDLGDVETQWGSKHMMRLVFELDGIMEGDDIPEKRRGQHWIVGKRYTVSLHEKASLRRDLKSWRGGKDLTSKERRQFDIESMIGQPCTVLIERIEKDGAEYAVIGKISKPQGKGYKASGKYVRKRDRPERDDSPRQSSSRKPAVVATAADSGDDIPF